MPEPSPGDLFLDLEGARFAREGGREYLFGLWTPTGYRAWWAFDDAQEKSAFEQVIDLLMQTWAVHPGMHVYHFGHYEASTFRRLMGRHATRGDELDRLLRGQRFVDLYAVVRQALRAGVESYSIKRLEPFYAFTRDVALDAAAPNLQAIELALESEAAGSIPEDVRAAVQGYNRDDCRSTQALRDWLESRRAWLEASGTPVPRPDGASPEPPLQVTELEEKEQAAAERLLASIPPEASDPTHADHPRWLFAHLLGWHRRENKAQYWERYRLDDLSEEERLDDGAALAGLEHVDRTTVVNKKTGRPTGSVVDRYRYPPQECEIGRKGELYVTGPLKFGKVVDHDRHARVISVQKGKKVADVHSSSVFESTVIGLDGLRECLLRLSHDLDAPGCGTDLLFRRSPRLRAGVFERQHGESETDFAVRLATTLDRTTLAVQGPPGAGKTHIGARMIRALIAAGKRVGVVAVSHKVIRNLLDAVQDQAKANERVKLGHKSGDADGDESPHGGGVQEFDSNEDALAALKDREVDVLGGTAWLWAREDFADSVDVLFVDEAGQMSLANVLAVSPAAGSLVLLGDPQQLQQPQKASHPDGVDISALEHVLGDHQTMPPERGLFLPITWRLAPAVCAFTSELFYEDKLESRAGLERQRLAGTGGYDGAGVWWVPVEHAGNRTSSPEEVDAVAALVDRLLAPGSQWVDGNGVASQMTAPDLRVVGPYNAHVTRLAERLGPRGVPVGTVDKFQGQEAAVVIYSMGSSSPADAPRGMEFLYSLNRLNVATSRARCAAFVVASPRLLEAECRTPKQMRLANALCRYVEMARTGEDYATSLRT